MTRRSAVSLPFVFNQLPEQTVPSSELGVFQGILVELRQLRRVAETTLLLGQKLQATIQRLQIQEQKITPLRQEIYAIRDRMVMFSRDPAEVSRLQQREAEVQSLLQQAEGVRDELNAQTDALYRQLDAGRQPTAK